MTKTSVPATQYAVQLTGPGRLHLNRAKPVLAPGPYQILALVEAVSLCFSDLKLLKQFSTHVRKGEIVSGVDPEVLGEIPSYVPGMQPTVPGHEVCARLLAVGAGVKHHRVGERVIVQADWRQLRTAQSNGAFGYNFEGGLQEYILLDERVLIDPDTGERFLIPAGDAQGAAALTLVEPWACVEDSYAAVNRRTIKAGGLLLVVADPGHAIEGLASCFSPQGKPASATVVCSEPVRRRAMQSLGLPIKYATGPDALPDGTFDDIVYFGANRATIEALDGKLTTGGILNLVTGGRKIGQPVSIDVGRIHYALTRYCGTTGRHAQEGYRHIPATGEVRPGDTVAVIGAGGPMGQIHVMRNLCTGARGVSVVAADLDTPRLESLGRKARPLAEAHGVPLRLVNTRETPLMERFSYIAMMVPAAAMVAAAIRDSAQGGLINIFAGIPIGTRQELDLDTYLARGCWMFGTSGSTISDMRLVLDKVEGGRLDTPCSVDAISGLAGAIDGIAALENRSVAGKIVVYPALRELGLIPLADLPRRFPTVAAKLASGLWTKAAEEELLAVAKGD